MAETVARPSIDLDVIARENGSQYSVWDPRAIMRAQLQELIDQIEAMQQAGGEYPIFYIINVVMAKLNLISDELRQTITKPLEHYQNISKLQSILMQRIEAIKKKQLAGEELTEQDLKDVVGAIHDIKQALKKFQDDFKDEDGNVKWPNKEVKDIFEKATKNINMIANERINIGNGNTVGLDAVDLNDPEEMKHALADLTRWAREANGKDENNNDIPPRGPFVEWDSGKGGAPGNNILKIILDTEVASMTDKLNRGSTIIQSFMSMGQKQVELAAALMRGIIANYIPR